jgi:hypothetical protein
VGRVRQLSFIKEGFIVIYKAGEERKGDTDQHALVLGELQ